jgi:hypothetical protein
MALISQLPPSLMELAETRRQEWKTVHPDDDFADSDRLVEAFSWNETPEGSHFWALVDDTGDWPSEVPIAPQINPEYDDDDQIIRNH